MEKKKLITKDSRFIRLPELKERVGLSKSYIYELARMKEFPAPVKLAKKASGWLEEEVIEWMSFRANKTGTYSQLPVCPSTS